MNKTLITILGIIVALMLVSCEKVIEVELDESDQEIVVEAKLKEGEQEFEVLVTKTAPYFSSDSPEGINDATVVLSDSESEIEVPLVEDGRYATEINARDNTTYTLRVEIEEEVYEATSYLPEKVALTEIYTEYEPGNPAVDEGYLVYYRYQDPAGVQNFYRTVHYVNEEPQLKPEDMQVLNDVLYDGGHARFPIFQKSFQPGEKVTVELVHFDEASFDYFTSLESIAGEGQGPGGGTAAPGNPISNWSGGILGYFSAYSSDSMSIVIDEL